MATRLEFSGSHTDDDDKNKNARRPQPAESFHMTTDQHILARPLLHEQVEKDDDDDEDEDKDDSRFAFRREEEESVEPEQADLAEPSFVEVPLRDVNMPPQEFIEPLPLSAVDGAAALEAAQAEHDDEDEAPQPSFGRTNPPIFRRTTPQPMERPAEVAPESLAELPTTPAAEAVVLGAAEQTLETAEPEAQASTPTLPGNPNVAPPSHNILPPTPNTPPNANAGGNFVPPVPPNHGGGFNGGNFNNLPPNPNNGGGQNYNYNVSPPGPNANIMTSPNFGNAANTVTNVVERTHTIERGSGNLLAGIALIGLLIERSKRKGGDAKLEKKIKEQRKDLETQRDELRLQNETINKQRHELRNADARTTELEQHAAERRRVAEAFGTTTTAASEASQTFAPGAERRTAAAGTTAERRTPVSVERNTATNAAEAADEAAQTKPFELQPDQHIARSAWHNIVVDSHGREVVDAMQYGQGFQQERQRETAPAAPRDTQVAGGTSVYSSASMDPIGVPLPGAFNPSLPAGMTNPALPADERSIYSDSQYLLPAPGHPVRNAATTVLLWLFVAVMAFAIVSGVRLLF